MGKVMVLKSIQVGKHCWEPGQEIELPDDPDELADLHLPAESTLPVERGPFRFALVPFVRDGCFMEAGEIWPRGPNQQAPEELTAPLEDREQYEFARGESGDYAGRWVLKRKDGTPGPENREGQRAEAERARVAELEKGGGPDKPAA